jgi:hypothetical protein
MLQADAERETECTDDDRYPNTEHGRHDPRYPVTGTAGLISFSASDVRFCG